MQCVCFGGFAFHAERRQLLGAGEEVHLTPKAFDLLGLLIERAPAVVKKPDIHKALWPDTFVSDAGRRPNSDRQRAARLSCVRRGHLHGHPACRTIVLVHHGQSLRTRQRV
jgi:DNA-binding response OmpR family regulator